MRYALNVLSDFARSPSIPAIPRRANGILPRIFFGRPLLRSTSCAAIEEGLAMVDRSHIYLMCTLLNVLQE